MQDNHLTRFLVRVIILPGEENMRSGTQKWQVQQELSSPRGLSMEPLKRHASTQSEGSCVTAMLASSIRRFLHRQCRNSTDFLRGREKAEETQRAGMLVVCTAWKSQMMYTGSIAKVGRQEGGCPMDCRLKTRDGHYQRPSE